MKRFQMDVRRIAGGRSFDHGNLNLSHGGGERKGSLDLFGGFSEGVYV